MAKREYRQQEYVKRSDKAYRDRSKRVLISFHREHEAELINWLMSHVEEESQIPAFIKGLVRKAQSQA